MSQPRRLYRSRSDEQISGVCAGLAQYLGVETVWVRIAFVLLTLINGAGILLYLILALVIPKEPQEENQDSPKSDMDQTLREGAQNLQERAKEVSGMQGGQGSQLLGWALVVVGAWFLLRQLGWIRVDEDLIFPLLLIGIGVLVLLRRAGR
ncbi:MAG: PspC domain-containing protein [Meiothermus sp.]|nr:PspC domain-containing protein [Meiothermus sp.]